MVPQKLQIINELLVFFLLLFGFVNLEESNIACAL